MKRGIFLFALFIAVILLTTCEKQNTPPVANFTITPEQGNTDTIFTFDATLSSDKEDESSVLQVHWDWENDGKWDTDFSTNKIIQHQYSETGTFMMVLEVKDSEGLLNSSQRAIEITPILPTVITDSITNISHNSGVGGGNIIKEGNGSVTAYGICWSTDENPNLGGDHTIDGMGIGEFKSSLQNLTSNTTYFVKSYATNFAGTAYSEQSSFTTANGTEEGTYMDIRDGNIYNIIKIGHQWWMSKNLAWLPYIGFPEGGSTIDPSYYVYNYGGSNVSSAIETSNYEAYGVLYNWEAAKTACPSGWHLSTDDEWIILEVFIGLSSVPDLGYLLTNLEISKKLKSITGWNNDGNGNNESGLNIYPGGARYPFAPFFGDAGRLAIFWTGTEINTQPVYHLFSDENEIGRSTQNGAVSYSVRCLKDE